MSKKRAQEGEKKTVDLSELNFVREAHNYLLNAKSGFYDVDELNRTINFAHYLLSQKPKKSYKVGLMLIAVNHPYWQYAKQVIEGVRQFFLPGHSTEIMLWTDMQQYPESKDVNYGATIFPVESTEWPYPTLMRYHFFLEQEEYLKQFDYLFYLDLDMRLVGVVGDEILGDGLMMAQHPMYALRQPLWLPYEPNEQSSAYIKQPGRVVADASGKQLFQPLYAAGGFQGGTTTSFLEAMKSMKENIDYDLERGYIARWNDESHWNKYLFDNKPSVVLSPSYVYPDSLINEYYSKIWGGNYQPRIITLTKPFTTSKEGGQAATQMMQNL